MKTIITPRIFITLPEGWEEGAYVAHILERILDEIEQVTNITCVINDTNVTLTKSDNGSAMVPNLTEFTNRLPKIPYESVNPGDVIQVKVGGVSYDTVIDTSGTQRFRKNLDNPLLKRLRNNPREIHNPKGDVEDLNEMSIRYGRGEFSKREYAEMNMANGYSVCGFADLSSFEDWDIDNPLWDE